MITRSVYHILFGNATIQEEKRKKKTLPKDHLGEGLRVTKESLAPLHFSSYHVQSDLNRCGPDSGNQKKDPGREQGLSSGVCCAHSHFANRQHVPVL